MVILQQNKFDCQEESLRIYKNPHDSYTDMGKPKKAIDLVVDYLKRAEQRGLMAKISRASGLNQSTLTRIRDGETKNPLFPTIMRILAAIIEVFPDINIEEILLTLSSAFISMLSEGRPLEMKDAEPIYLILSIIANRNYVDPKLYDSIVNLMKVAYEQAKSRAEVPKGSAIN